MFEVLLGSDLIAIGVDELQREISEDPIESREVLSEELRVVVVVLLPLDGVELDVLGEVDHETEVLQGILINGAQGVVNEGAGCEDREGENASVVGLVFIEGADAFGVDDQHIDGFSFRGLTCDRLVPAPESLGAGVDGRTNSKTIAAVEQHTIQQV
jgi:hypothetical protein